ncbi:TPA: tRNA 2-thiocytidine(32) synthetase TtcA [bacterium]|nr:tRNA 2-thiocytidine(32) synthetase TtcA [bacterium]
MYYPRSIIASVRRADEDYSLIEDGDRIAVGISGGKDSLLLLYILNLYKKVVSKRKHFEVIGIHIKMGFPNMDITKMLEYYEDLGIKIEVMPSNTYDILKANKTKDGKLPCSICSKIKKAIVIEGANKFNCNKVAFAHHADDAIETLLMNSIFGGKIATFKPKMYLDRTDTTFIRPFVYVREKDIIHASNKFNLPIVESTCPNDKHTERENMKTLLNDLYNKYPSSRSNFLLMLHNLEKLDLWVKEKKKDS